MPSSIQAATQTATPGTDHDLVTHSGAGTFVLLVDATNLAAGEALTLRLQAKVLSGGSLTLVDEVVFRGGQGAPFLQSVAVVSLYELRAQLRQDGGTGRAFPWNLVAL